MDINSPLYSPGADMLRLREESKPGSWVFLVLAHDKVVADKFRFSASLIFMGKITGFYLVYENKCTLGKLEAHFKLLLTLEKHMVSLKTIQCFLNSSFASQ